MFTQMKSALKKFFSEQPAPITSYKLNNVIKLEPEKDYIRTRNGAFDNPKCC